MKNKNNKLLLPATETTVEPRLDNRRLFLLWLLTTIAFIMIGLFAADITADKTTSHSKNEVGDKSTAATSPTAVVETTPQPNPEQPEDPQPTNTAVAEQPANNPEPNPTEPEPAETAPQTQEPPTITDPNPAPIETPPPETIPTTATTDDPEPTVAVNLLEPDPDPAPQPAPAPEPTTVASLSQRIKLSPLAENNYWEQTDPRIASPEEIRRACQQIEHIIHGCYLRLGRVEEIYIVDTTCPGLTESTAVHELLHSIYSHLSPNERQRINLLILDFYEQNRSTFDHLLAPYSGLSQSGRINELHSFIGQSIQNLPAELRQHYNRYFSDGRRAAVDYHQQYQSMLDSRRQRISRLGQEIRQEQFQLEHQRQQISMMRQLIDGQPAWFEAQKKLLEELRNELTDLETNSYYNQLVDDYNRLSEEYQQLTDDYNQAVNDYNQLVEQVRHKIADHNQLVEQVERINRGDCRKLD